MFEFLLPVMKDGIAEPNAVNARYPVTLSDITSAEERLGFAFPPQLKAFFTEIGCGFLKNSDPNSDVRGYYVNRFLDPDEVATLILGEDEEVTPSEGFEEGDFPFFEVTFQFYIVIRTGKHHNFPVGFSYGREVSPDLITFLRNLMDNPRFYHGNK